MTQQDDKDSEKHKIDQDLIRALPRLTPEQVAKVSPKLVRQTYGPGEIIIQQGDTPDRFYILISGRVEIVHEDLDGDVEIVDFRGSGDYFGEIGLLTDQPRTATVRVHQEDEVEVLAMNRQDFQEMIEKSKGTEAHVARDMIQRLISLANYYPS